MTNFLSCIIFFWKDTFFFFELGTESRFPGTPWTCGRKGSLLEEATPLPSYCGGDCQWVHSLCEETKAINHTGTKPCLWLAVQLVPELPWKLGALSQGPCQCPWVREGSSNRQPLGNSEFLEKRSPRVCD